MDWPPQIGEPLPRAEDAFGVRRKLADYALDTSHPKGRLKAQGFSRILGITIDEIDYLEAEIHIGILTAPILAVRENRRRRMNCVVESPLRGIGDQKERMVKLRTIWEIAAFGDRPRLVSALLKP